MANDVKASVVQNISTAEIIATLNISDESKVRIVISNAAGGNTIVIRGRITGQLDWDTISTLTGNNKTAVSVKTYDEVQIECTVYASASNYVRVVVSSFSDAGGSTVIDAPAGGQIDSDAITLTSSDSSITITNDPVTNTIDFVATGVGGLSKYTSVFNNTTDWVLNGSNYELTVLAATYGSKANPVIYTFETIAGVDTEVFPAIIKNVTNDIILQVTQVPDNRYTGKIIIL